MTSTSKSSLAETKKRQATEARIKRRTSVELAPYYTPAGEMILVAVAGKILDVTPRRVRAFISEGRLPAIKVGKQYIIKYSDLMDFANKPRPSGRPEEK